MSHAAPCACPSLSQPWQHSSQDDSVTLSLNPTCVRHVEAVEAFGADSMAMSCFKGIVHALACSASYADGVRTTLVAGGENVGRASLVSSQQCMAPALDSCTLTHGNAVSGSWRLTSYQAWDV